MNRLVSYWAVMSDAVRAAHDLSTLVATPPAGGAARLSAMVARIHS